MPLALTIDPEFEALLDRHTPAELEQLEHNLLQAGRARDAIVVWKNTRIILDGMTRYKLCVKHRLPFDTVNENPPNRAAAIRWIVDNQTGRRNLSAESRQRIVAALRKEGQSTRQIAEAVKASQTTVRNDLKASGEQNCSPEKVTGKDGKTYAPTRPILASPVAGEACEPPRDGRLPKRLPNGKVKFDHKLIDKALRGVAGLIERMGAAYGKHQHYRKCDMLGNEFAGAVQTWHKEMA